MRSNAHAPIANDYARSCAGADLEHRAAAWRSEQTGASVADCFSFAMLESTAPALPSLRLRACSSGGYGRRAVNDSGRGFGVQSVAHHPSPAPPDSNLCARRGPIAALGQNQPYAQPPRHPAMQRLQSHATISAHASSQSHRASRPSPNSTRSRSRCALRFGD